MFISVRTRKKLVKLSWIAKGYNMDILKKACDKENQKSLTKYENRIIYRFIVERYFTESLENILSQTLNKINYNWSVKEMHEKCRKNALQDQLTEIIITWYKLYSKDFAKKHSNYKKKTENFNVVHDLLFNIVPYIHYRDLIKKKIDLYNYKVLTEIKKKKQIENEIIIEKEKLKMDVMDLKEYQKHYQDEITVNQRICQELLKVQELTLKITEQINLLKAEIRVIEKENFGLTERIIIIEKQINTEQKQLVENPQNIVRVKKKTDDDLKNVKKSFVEEESKFLELKGKLLLVERTSNRLKEIEWLSWQPIIKIISHVDKLKNRLKKKKWSIVQTIDQIKSKKKIIKQQRHFLKKKQLYTKLREQTERKRIKIMSLQKQKFKKTNKRLDDKSKTIKKNFKKLKKIRNDKLLILSRLKCKRKLRELLVSNLLEKYKKKKREYLNKKFLIEIK